MKKTKEKQIIVPHLITLIEGWISPCRALSFAIAVPTWEGGGEGVISYNDTLLHRCLTSIITLLDKGRMITNTLIHKGRIITNTLIHKDRIITNKLIHKYRKITNTLKHKKVILNKYT